MIDKLEILKDIFKLELGDVLDFNFKNETVCVMRIPFKRDLFDKIRLFIRQNI